jgi:hypothetical protein
VDAMLAQMSSRQFSEWQAYWQVEPWGDYREDWRTANLLAFLSNWFRKESDLAITPAQFMPMLDPTGETELEMTVQDQAQTAFEANYRQAMGEG